LSTRGEFAGWPGTTSRLPCKRWDRGDLPKARITKVIGSFSAAIVRLPWTLPTRYNESGIGELQMGEKDLSDLLQALKDVASEHASSKEKAQEFLQNEGVLTSNGELTEPYR
jgi:hypothetical protein